MKNKIIIIGLGNIGRRHLQAAAKLPEIESIVCQDINKLSLASTKEFLKKEKIKADNIRFTSSLDEILTNITQETIVIVASTAKDRSRLIADVLAASPMAILAEKPLCQSLDEYDRLMAMAKEFPVPIYVNFSRRMYELYQEIHRGFQREGECFFTAVFSGGFSCSGIHMLDLLSWIFDVRSYQILHTENQAVLPSKRKDYFDLSGVLTLKVNGKNYAFLSAPEGDGHFLLEICSPQGKYRIYETSGQVVIQKALAGIEVRSFEKPPTSKLTDKIIMAIIRKKKVELPDIFESFMAHKMLFDYMACNNLERVNIT